MAGEGSLKEGATPPFIFSPPLEHYHISSYKDITVREGDKGGELRKQLSTNGTNIKKEGLFAPLVSFPAIQD
jgi:hypothetical protein